MKFSTLVRAFLLIVALCGLLFYVAANFSIKKESRYRCVGTLKYNDTETPTTLYIKIQEYRWWVSLWNDTDIGTIYVEGPGSDLDSFYITDKSVWCLHLRDWDEIRGDGRFFLLSNTLKVKWNGGYFTGIGTLIPN